MNHNSRVNPVKEAGFYDDIDFYGFGNSDLQDCVPRHHYCDDEDEKSDRDDSCSERYESSEKYFREEREAIIRDIEFYSSCEYDFACASKKDTNSSLVVITNGINLFREKEFGQVTIPYYSLPVKFWKKKCRIIHDNPVSFCCHCGIVLPSLHKNDICDTCIDYVEDDEYLEDLEDLGESEDIWYEKAKKYYLMAMRA